MALHVKEGLFFEPQEGGGVRIYKQETAKDSAPIVFDLTLDEGSWQSVVLQMAYGPSAAQNGSNPS
jgi:hypothetical protein